MTVVTVLTVMTEVTVFDTIILKKKELQKKCDKKVATAVTVGT